MKTMETGKQNKTKTKKPYMYYLYAFMSEVVHVKHINSS